VPGFVVAAAVTPPLRERQARQSRNHFRPIPRCVRARQVQFTARLRRTTTTATSIARRSWDWNDETTSESSPDCEPYRRAKAASSDGTAKHTFNFDNYGKFG
jgi:hypothetical protein